MKTKAIYTVTMIALTTLFSITLSAIEHIPFLFTTNPSSMDYSNNEIYDNNLMDFDFTEEAYIDDIPFDTECISIDCLYQKALDKEYHLVDEKYISDIPFDTKHVKANVLNSFDLDDEAYIDDIPFDTHTIVENNTLTSLN